MGEDAQTLVGRGPELELLDGALSDAFAGRGGLVAVTGEPGIGKTALARAFVDIAAARGAAWAWGTCWDGGGAPAYWPWVQIARALARREDAAGLRAGLGDGAPWIAGLLPELADTLGPPARASDLNADQARFRLFDALAGLLGTVASRRPLVVVLDDLHWADVSSVLALQFVARALPDLPVLMIAAYRNTAADAHDELSVALAGLARSARRVPLTGLGRDAVARLASASAGAQARIAPRLIEAVHDASAGNPFFVDALVQLLASQGRLQDERSAGDPLPLPDGVRETIRQRLAPLDEPAANTLRAAAVIGATFRLVTLARVAGEQAAVVLERLEAPLRAGILSATGEPGQFAFVHALVRDTLLSDLDATERARLHLATAQALELLYEAEVEPHLAEIAHHFLQATAAGGTRHAVAYAARAARRAISQFAYHEAARLYERAIEVAASLEADDRRSWELCHGLGEALVRAGDIAGGRAALREAADHARRLEDPQHLAHTALAGTPPGLSPGVVETDLVALLEEALARQDAWFGDPGRAIADDALRCRLRVQLALSLFWAPEHERRAQLVDDALMLARGMHAAAERQGSPATRAIADRTLAFTLAQGFPAVWGPDTAERGLPISDEALELCERTHDAELAMQVRLWRISLLLELGDPLRADAEIEAYGTTARRLGQPRTLVYDPLHRALAAHMRGSFAVAERHTAQAAEQSRGLQGSLAPIIADGQTFVLRRTQGRHLDLEPLLRRHADRLPHMRGWRCALALVLAELGRTDEARKELEQLAADDFGVLARDATWLFAASMLAELCALLGDRLRARRLYELLAPFEGRHAISMGTAYLGPVARYLGLLAMTIGEDERALGHLETARSAAMRMDARPTAVLAALDAAEVLVRRRAPGDAERAAALVERFAIEAQELGMEGATARVAELRARLPARVQRAPAAPAGAAPVSRLVRRQDVWLLEHEGRHVSLPDSKGLRQLARLLANPQVPIAALTLVEAAGDPGVDAAGLEPAPASPSVRALIGELRDELAEARAFNDPERAARAGAQLEALADELVARSAGAAAAERARVNVTRALKAALRRIGEHEPELGRLLGRTIRTGTTCAYQPDPDAPLLWEVGT